MKGAATKESVLVGRLYIRRGPEPEEIWQGKMKNQDKERQKTSLVGKRDFTRAKHVLSAAEGTLSTQSDGPRSVIPSKREGSKKDFSLRSKMDTLAPFAPQPEADPSKVLWRICARQ